MYDADDYASDLADQREEALRDEALDRQWDEFFGALPSHDELTESEVADTAELFCLDIQQAIDDLRERGTVVTSTINHLEEAS